MSVKITALVWELSLPLPDKMVLLRMADYADDRGGSIYPAVATIAHYCEMSPRAVQYTLKKYLDDGLLIVLGVVWLAVAIWLSVAGWRRSRAPS